MHTLNLTQIGNSVGAIFPKDLVARLQLEKGDALYVTDTPDGLRITTHNPEFEAQMRVARDIMKERRAVLHELANPSGSFAPQAPLTALVQRLIKE